MDKDTAIQEIGYIGARLREKSTYAGLAVGLAFLFGLSKGHINIDPTALAGALEMLGMGVGSLCMILLPEKSVKAVIAFLVVGVGLAIGMPEARAGDVNAPAAVATKASPQWSLGQYPDLNGLIIGIYTEVGAGSVHANVPGVPPASVTTTTGAIGLTVGYIWTPKNGNISLSIENDACAQNFNGSNIGLSFQGPLCFEQRFMIFAPWDKLLAALPSLPNPFSQISAFNFPNGITAAGNMRFGIGAGAYERDISTAFAGVQTGKVWQAEPELVFMNVQPLSNGTALRGWVKIGFPQDSKVFGAVPKGATLATFSTPDARAGVGVAF